MSEIMKSYTTIEYLHERKPFFVPTLETRMIFPVPNEIIQSKINRIRLIGGGGNKVKDKAALLANYSEEGSVQAALDNSPISLELEPILTESQFDRIIAEAQQLEEPVIIEIMDWIEKYYLWHVHVIQDYIGCRTASWCRKCIYLKPKLEKLAAEYYPRVRFFHVDVNNVSHKLVVRAGVTKMPTIQLWKDGQKEGEVIGGHKAHLVVNEIREMIENEYTL